MRAAATIRGSRHLTAQDVAEGLPISDQVAKGAIGVSLADFTISAYINGIRSLSLLTTDVLAAAGGDCGKVGQVPAFFFG